MKKKGRGGLWGGGGVSQGEKAKEQLRFVFSVV